MEFREYVLQHLALHPAAQMQDVLKLCYQAACGAEHLLGDLEGAKAYFEEEYASVLPTNEPLYERISEGVCRVNLGAWKQRDLPKEELFRMFAGTVFSSDGKQRLTEYLDTAERVLRESGFDMAAWQSFTEAYKQDGMPAVRHSEAYRKAEQPAYRIVDAAYIPKLMQLNQ